MTCRNGVSLRSISRRISLQHQPLRQAAALKVRMRAHAADLSQHAGVRALARHRNQSRAIEDTEVFAKLDGAQAERTGMRQLGELECLRRVLRIQRHCVRCFVRRRHVGFPDHLEHRRLDFDLPAGRSCAGPALGVEVFARLAERSECG